MKQIRKSYGYTQENLAEKIDCSARYISEIEQDRSKPSYETLVKICNVFGIGLDSIFRQYLEVKENGNVEYCLLGFKELQAEDKNTIAHLISYFNKCRIEAADEKKEKDTKVLT